MTAPASLPALIAEGRRLIAEYARAKEEGLDYTANALWDEGCAFWDANGAALLDVAEAGARNSWAREEYGLASGASHAERGSICETCERTRDAAQAVLDSEDALDSALSRLRGVTT